MMWLAWALIVCTALTCATVLALHDHMILSSLILVAGFSARVSTRDRSSDVFNEGDRRDG